MTARIEKVLAAKDPSLTDENDWEEFSLTNVKVRIPGKARYANILSASADNPLSVTGQLDMVEEDQESLVLDPDYRTKRIVINDVTHYAYGQHDDGEVGIWVAGEAGWFAISPAKGYNPMFSEATEAVDLLYFIADKHQHQTRGRGRGRKGKNWNPKLNYLFDEYTRHTHGAYEDAEEAAEVFYKHHGFLIKQMLQGKEGIDWVATPVYAHLLEKYPDVFEELETASHNSDVEEEETEEEKDGDYEGEAEEDDNDDRSADNAVVERSQADTIFETILEMREAGAVSKRKMNLKSIAEALLKKYEMPSLDYALDLIRARASYLIEMMDNAQTSTFDWSSKAVYRKLKETENQEGTKNISTTPLQPRPTKDGDSGNSSSSSSEDSDEDVQFPKGGRRRMRKSILRPKLSSVSAKGAGKRNRLSRAQSFDSEGEDINEMSRGEETPTRQGASYLVHEPLVAMINESIRSINPDSDTHSQTHISTEENTELFKKPNLPNSKNSITPLPLDPSSPSDDDDADLPPDTWVCSEPGCDKTVCKASSKRSKEAIFDHSLVHADNTQTKLDLVFAEQRLNINASVGNLVSRIRDFGTFQDDPADIFANGTMKKTKL